MFTSSRPGSVLGFCFCLLALGTAGCGMRSVLTQDSDGPALTVADAGTGAAGNGSDRHPCGRAGTEGCDPTDLDGHSCQSLGAGSGTLACDPVTCTFDLSLCTGLNVGRGNGGTSGGTAGINGGGAGTGATFPGGGGTSGTGGFFGGGTAGTSGGFPGGTGGFFGAGSGGTFFGGGGGTGGRGGRGGRGGGN